MFSVSSPRVVARALLLYFTLSSALPAQAQEAARVGTASDAGGRADKSPSPPPPAADNPLVLPVSPDGSAPVYYTWDGTKRSDGTVDAGTSPASAATPPKEKKPLPLFIFDYFEPARRIIDARRAAMRRRYSDGGSLSAQKPRTLQSDEDRLGDTSLTRPGGTRQDADGAGPRAMSAEERALARSSQSRGQDTRQGDFSNGDTSSLTSQGASVTGSDSPDAKPGLVTGDDARQNSPDDDTTLPVSSADVGSETTTSSRYRQRDDSALAETKRDENRPGDSPQNPNGEPDRERANAFNDAVDPLTQSISNMTASIPPSYQLAPGDTLMIRYWSPTHAEQDFTATLDPQGAILLEHARRVVVRGLTMTQAEAQLRRQLGHLYRNVDVSVTLKELRSISITVGGAAYAPGTYVVPSVATAFNVLYAAGGPTEDGSLRKIEIRRRGRLVGILDVYKFVTVGSQAGDVSLQPGDLLYIPPRLSRVTIEGEVGSPAIFELTPTETLKDGLHYAGGVKPSAVGQHVQISTVTPGTARVLKDVDLRDQSQVAKTALYDGDTIDVFSLRGTLMNSVTVEGAVDQPGDYALADGMRVSDLVMRARGPLSEAYLSRADLFRWNPDNTLTLIAVDMDKALAGDATANLALKRWDRLKVYSREEVAWTGRRDVTVRGAVQRPGVYYRSANMRLRDLLLMAGGPTPEASLSRAVLLHQRGDGTFAYDFIDLEAALHGDATQDVEIQDNDVLALYRVGEAQFTPKQTVSIRGEVVTPGDYPRGENMKLSDLLKLAGGLKPGAAPRVTIGHARHKSSDAALASVRVDAQGETFCGPSDDVALADGDVVTVQGTGGYKDHVEVVTIKGAVNSPGPVILKGSNMRLSDAIEAAGGLRPEAYPLGAEFVRSPDLIGTAGQRALTQVVSQLNDEVNQSAYQREQAKSDIERIKATSQASAPDSSPLGAGTSAPPAAPTAGAAQAALGDQLARRDLVSKPRVLRDEQLAPDGNVAINLASALRRPGGGDDITLMDGDTITIPQQPTTVQVVGAVISARAVLFRPGANVSYYVANSGGFAPDAATDRLVVIRVGGGLVAVDKAGPLQPGDMIVVPTRVMAEKLSDGHSSHGLSDIFRSITSSAITYKLATGLFGL